MNVADERDELLYFFHDFYSSRQLLDFLQISRAAFLPPQRLAVPYDPG